MASNRKKSESGDYRMEADQFYSYYVQLRDPKKSEQIQYSPGTEERITRRLRSLGISVTDYNIDPTDYWRYFVAARYLQNYPDYYSFNRPEKSLEHYLALRFLQLEMQDIYIDIASEHSPVPEIYQWLFGLTAYRQDLEYPSGIHGRKIGGDAAHMPVPDEFATKMALHCSFEHFEGESDIGFVREMARVLSPGGKACIAPLYLFDEYAIQTDPVVAVQGNVVFEDDAALYCAQGWGNRHGRFYDPEHFASRVCANLGDLRIQIYRIMNAQTIDTSCYVRFALLVTKP